MTFYQLERACQQVGLSASIYQYDCGERVTVRRAGRVLFSSDKECGQEPNAVDMAGAYLLAQGFITDDNIPAPRRDTD